MTYRITFGQKFRRERHPYGCHPDGWSEVQATSLENALAAIRHRYGDAYSNVYEHGSEDYPTTELYPRGLIEKFYI